MNTTIHPTIGSAASVGLEHSDGRALYRIEHFQDSDGDPVVDGWAWLHNGWDEREIDEISQELGYDVQAIVFRP
jgi:hypothetical protein